LLFFFLSLLRKPRGVLSDGERETGRKEERRERGVAESAAAVEGIRTWNPFGQVAPQRSHSLFGKFSPTATACCCYTPPWL